MGLTDQNSRSEAFAVFARAGLPRELVTAWLDSDDAPSADFRADCEKFSRRWGMGGELLERLPLKPGVENIMGVNLRKVTIPVAAGRNLAVLVEAAVRNYVLQLRGIDSTRDFISLQTQQINES